jgi:hypothetical protein
MGSMWMFRVPSAGPAPTYQVTLKEGAYNNPNGHSLWLEKA